ncbi:hypothetical protein CEXT_138191 [Caerostris extrusa]|uniref:Maturase K n=1 Tax=Caerostris extrusa TaxID=172846 RepID=A0AAV4QRS4_CAEEX|nr:hypothetical protein CEXT_138191 [Caerostris extrusa]
MPTIQTFFSSALEYITSHPNKYNHNYHPPLNGVRSLDTFFDKHPLPSVRQSLSSYISVRKASIGLSKLIVASSKRIQTHPSCVKKSPVPAVVTGRQR